MKQQILRNLITTYGLHLLKNEWMLNEIRRGTNRMSECRELLQKCNECNNKIMWNSKNACEDCDKVNRSSLNV